MLGIHGGLPQLLGVHLTQTFESLHGHAVLVATGILVDELAQLHLVPAILFLAALLGAGTVQGWGSDVEVAVLDDGSHAAEEEGHQQGVDVCAIDVGIGHDDDAVIAQFAQVGLLGILLSADGHTQGTEDDDYRFALKHLVVHRLLDVQNLTAQGQDGLELAVTALLGATTCRVTLDEEEFALGGILRRAVGQFAGQATAGERRLALHLQAGILGGVACLCGQDDLLDDGLGLCGMLLQIGVQGITHGGLDGTDDLGVSEFGLGLALELGLQHFDRNDGCQTLAEVLRLNLNLGLLEHLVVLGILLQGRAQTAAEARQVGTTLDGVDVVDKRVDVLVERRVIGHSDLDGDVALLALDVDDVLDQGLLVAIDVAHKLVKTGLAVVGLAAGIAVLVAGAQVGNRQGHSGVQVGQVAQAVGQDVKLIDRG